MRMYDQCPIAAQRLLDIHSIALGIAETCATMMELCSIDDKELGATIDEINERNKLLTESYRDEVLEILGTTATSCQVCRTDDGQFAAVDRIDLQHCPYRTKVKNPDQYLED